MFEIAVLKFGEICYDTPVSYDLEGYLDFEDVIEVLHEIHNLLGGVGPGRGLRGGGRRGWYEE